MKNSSFLLFLFALTSGCANFRQPPLPRGAASAPPAPPAKEEAWMQDVRGADVIYFSLTTNESNDAEAASKMAAEFNRRAQAFAFGWAKIATSRQPLLDRWHGGEISGAELANQLARPERSGILPELPRSTAGEIALGCASQLLTKLRDGAALTAEERAQLPNDFRVRPDALEDFAERVSDSPHLRRLNLRFLFRAHLVAEEAIAENIVRFRREHTETKLLVFLPNDALIDPREVANFVAQKIPARQLILDRAQPLRARRPELLARRGRHFQIVKREPGIIRHDESLAAPRLRA